MKKTISFSEMFETFFKKCFRVIKERFAQLYTLVATFFFEAKGAKKKVIKKETPRIVSRSAEREEGCAPSTAPPFEERHTRKRAAKTFFKMTMRITLSAS